MKYDMVHSILFISFFSCLTGGSRSLMKRGTRVCPFFSFTTLKPLFGQNLSSFVESVRKHLAAVLFVRLLLGGYTPYAYTHAHTHTQGTRTHHMLTHIRTYTYKRYTHTSYAYTHTHTHAHTHTYTYTRYTHTSYAYTESERERERECSSFG